MGASANVVSAKVRALYGHRLMPEDYNAMLHAHSVSEVASYLKAHTGYKAALADVNESTLHRGYLETILRRCRFEQLTALSRYESMTRMPLSEAFIRFGEIRQLLLFLRLLGAGRPEAYFFDMPLYFNSHSRLNLVGLSEVRSYDDLCALLDGTEYARTVRQFPPDENGRIPLPETETALYTDWYREFFDRIRRYTHGEERRQLTELLSQHLNTRNVLRIYRLKQYFDRTPEQIRPYLIAPSCGMPQASLERLLQADAGQVIPLFAQMPAGRGIPADRFADLAQLQHHVTAYRSRHYIHYSVYPSVVLLSYMFISGAEVDDIVNIIEGIRYGLSPAQIRRLLTVSMR